MRSLLFVAFLMFVTLGVQHAAEKGQAPKTDLAGAWSVTWDANPANTNPLKLSMSDDSLKGTYINDQKESCEVTGHVDNTKGTVTFTITGPKKGFTIQCEGLLANPNLVQGRYLAYGTVQGSFRMVRSD